jgi:hypothetical protein
MRGRSMTAEERIMREVTNVREQVGAAVSRRPLRLAMLAVASGWLVLATVASAGVTGDPSEFSLCPTSFTAPADSPTGLLCSHNETTGGEIAIGNSIVPINNNPDTVDFGAYSNSSAGFFGPEVIVTPTNGQVFGGPAQVVPGGLLGLTGKLAPLSKPLDPVNEVRSSIELAGPITPATVVDPTATKTYFCATGPFDACDAPSPSSVITVPIKVHLINPVLGPNCYIGSNADPIVLNLEETPTSQPVFGGSGNAIIVTGVEVADSTFAAPGTSGCGLGGLLDPVLDLKVGLPSPSGRNSALIDEDGEIEPADLL